MSNYHLNEIVYCNSNSIIGEKCRIKSTRHTWTQSSKYSYGYLVYSLDTKETFEVPEERIFPTKALAKYNSGDTNGSSSLTYNYEKNINSIDELLKFAAVHMQNTQLDKAAVEAFKNKSLEILDVDIDI